MDRYSISNSRAGVNAANTIMWQLRATGTTTRVRLLEIGLGVKGAPTTAPAFQLVRTTAVGTSSTTTAGTPYDQNDSAAVGTLDSAWSANPTLGTGVLRESVMATTAGGQTFWTFYDQAIELPISTTGGLAIVNTVATGTTVGTFVCYMVWEE